MFLNFAIKKPVLLLLVFCFFQLVSQAQESAVQAKGVYSSDFVIDGIPRNISFYIPLNYGKNDTYPLMLFLHAESETGKTVIKKYGDIIQQLADSSGCIVVYPDAVKGRWSTRIGEHAVADTINDIGFLNIMIDYFIQQYRCDPDRIFAAGFYNGGEMAWRLGCGQAKKVAAIAPFITSTQAAAKECTPNIYFDAEKFMPPPGKKIGNEVLTTACNLLLAHAKH